MIIKTPGKISIMVGGKVVGVAESAKLTFADDTEPSAKDDRWRNATHDSEQSFGFVCGGIVSEPNQAQRDLMHDFLKGTIDVIIRQELGHLPRKLKKAKRSDYRRMTKWKRKLMAHIHRGSIKIRNAEMVVTPDDQEKLRAIIHGGTIEHGCVIPAEALLHPERIPSLSPGKRLVIPKK